MPTPVITLISDYGEDSAYTAMLKGALWRHCPAARIVDLAHTLDGDDPFAAAFFLLRVHSYYPAGTVHVVAIDRGGGENVIVVTAVGQQFLAFDNGALSLVAERVESAPGRLRVRAVAAAGRGPFAARDLLAPLAGALARGADPAGYGAPAGDWKRFSLPAPRAAPDAGIEAEVLHVDRFGNLILNVTTAHLSAARQPAACVGRTRVTRWRAGFADARPGECFLYWGAEGWLEIALAGGSAARRLRARRGTRVLLR
jgi:S-adenosylmethionine hydrolase